MKKQLIQVTFLSASNGGGVHLQQWIQQLKFCKSNVKILSNTQYNRKKDLKNRQLMNFRQIWSKMLPNTWYNRKNMAKDL